MTTEPERPLYCPKCGLRADKPGPPLGYEHPPFNWTWKLHYFAENWHGKDYRLLEVVVLPARAVVGLFLAVWWYFVKIVLWYIGLVWVVVHLLWWAVRWPWKRGRPRWVSPAQIPVVVLGDY